jgi:hypothetical protein
VRFAHLLRRGVLSALVLGSVTACSSEALEPRAETLEQAVCLAPEESLVSESIDDACGCAAVGATDALRSSCGRGISAELLARLQRQMRSDCVVDLGACEATVGSFQRCSDAANEELSETCNVDFPAGCEELALAPGCASFVGCPAGSSRIDADGVASCIADPPSQAATEGGPHATALTVLGSLKETAGPAVRPLAR